MQFLDEVKIYLKSGDGGPGCVSFRREKNIPHGGPNGGDGGRGGDVIFECVAGLNTLIDFRYKQHFKAKNGEHGKGKNRHGESRDALIIKVPVGTQIIAEDGETLIADMMNEGDIKILLKGGDGGFGNAHYKSSTNQAPTKFTPGWPGEELWVWLRLKLISDAGLVGLPNAGKSTFLARTTSAKPKIADYPFTTLKPQLGVVYIDDTEFVLADIPGLIENAHLGAGLGDKFLKHLERCRVLLHLIDGTSEDVVQNYKTIRNELKEYGTELKKKKQILALNKCDALSDEEIEEKKHKLEKISKNEVFAISAASGDNVTTILRKLKETIDSDKQEELTKEGDISE
ncbi:MAG: GTPase ObgE [Alphaproteobacteria bacterium]